MTPLVPVVRHVVGMALKGHAPDEWHDALVGREVPTPTCKSVVAAVRLALVEFQDKGDPEGDRDVLNEEEILALLVSKKIPNDVAEIVVDSFLEASC